MPDERCRLTQQEAAGYLGVTDRTIRDFIRLVHLTGYRLSSKKVRVDRADLDALLRPIPGTTEGD